MTDKQMRLTSGHRLARNVLWNLVGAGSPLFVAIVAIPALIEGLGTARFGVLTLAWMVVGYFSLFDLGLGRALTKMVAEKLGQEQHDEIPALIWSAMSLMAVLGVLGAAIIAALSPWLVGSVLKVPPELQSETLITFYLLAVSIPIVISSTGFRGVLEAHQRFGLINVVRMFLGIITFLGPVAVLPFSSSLVPVVTVLVIARLVSWCAYVVLCTKVEPSLLRSFSIHKALIMPLIKFGGWMTVTNIIGPLMVYLDRFVIATAVSMAAVAYYATPYEIITKLWIVPGAVMGVMFPAFAVALVKEPMRAAYLYVRSINYILILIFPVVLVVITFSYEGLTLWLGSEFAKNGAVVLQLLAFGVFINCLTQVPFGMVQSAGRPDLTAKLHMVELPLYLLILWWLLESYGIVGAAFAWLFRVTIDAIFLFILAHKLLPVTSAFLERTVLTVGAAIVILPLGAAMPDITLKILFLLFVLLLFVSFSWLFIIESDEKKLILKYFKKVLVFT